MCVARTRRSAYQNNSLNTLSYDQNISLHIKYEEKWTTEFQRVSECPITCTCLDNESDSIARRLVLFQARTPLILFMYINAE